MPDLIHALGTRRFGPSMAAFADQLFGGHVCFVYLLQDDRLTPLAAGHVPPDPTDVLLPNMWRYTARDEWRHDVCLHQALARTATQAQAHFHDVGGRESRRHWPWDIPTPLVDKLVLCERTADGQLVLEFSRWGAGAGFDAAARDAAVEIGQQLMALTWVHQRLLAETTELTARERQVCALQLIGAKPADASETLGIAAESVKSYRKRAYLRLDVAGERELMLRFLALSAGWRAEVAESDAPDNPLAMRFLQAWRG